MDHRSAHNSKEWERGDRPRHSPPTRNTAEDERTMSWIDGLTRNWADLTEDGPDPTLRPIELPSPPAEAVTWAASVLAQERRWKVVAADPAAGTLHATHATRLWRFVDDVRLTFLPHGPGTRVVGQSRSRLGKGDFGQNARNLRVLARLLREAAGAGRNDR
jgi:uncharacterized protein (DUF1499 family)